MRNIFILFTIAFISISVKSKGQDKYQRDLQKLYSIIQKLPSYKDQIRNGSMKSYNKLYHSLQSDTIKDVEVHKIFYNLSKLFFPINDNHLGFYELPEFYLNQAEFNDSIAIKKYRNSSMFQNYPKINLNFDSLENNLNHKPKDSIEGLYYYQNFLKIGLYHLNNSNEYLGLVLSSEIPNWETGQVAIRLFEYAPAQFKAIYGHPLFKNLMLYNNEKFKNYSLINSYFYSSISESIYKKEVSEEKDHVNLSKSLPTFIFQDYGDVKYLRLGNFSTFTSELNKSNQFYNSIKNSLVSKHLILDLRNNSGGSFNVSKKYLKLIQKYSNRREIYILVNNGTFSQAEIFTLQLKKTTNCRVLGEQTNGTLAYGSNYGKIEKLPSERFQVYITDMKDKGHYRNFEGKGIAPDILLKSDSDWILQAREIIKSN